MIKTKLFKVRGLRHMFLLGLMLFFCTSHAVGQSGAGSLRTITGTVVDQGGEPLVGVAVYIDQTTRGASTDVDGNFELQAASDEVLVVSYIGYATQRIEVDSSNHYPIVLLEQVSELDEVVVTALGIKRASKALSYNVQNVNSDEVNVVKNANFMNSLQGKVAGVQINTSAGGPGSSVRVVMRGTKSISKDNNALYVIDGIPMFNVTSQGSVNSRFSTQASSDAVADINPEDIASMSMLTGAPAAALYGSNAANGVVLITTKRGVEGKTQVTYSNNTMFSTPYIYPDMQNTYGNVAGQYQSWGGKTSNSYNPMDFFNTGSDVINSFTFSTGNAKNQTFASVSSTNSDGIVPNNSYDRYNFTIRNTTNINDKLKLDLGASYIIQNDQNMVGQGEYQNPLVAVYLFPRGDNFDDIRAFERYSVGSGLYTQHWPYGDQGLSLQNPYWQQYRMNRETDKLRYMLNAGLTYNIADWINVSGRVAIDNTNSHYTRKENASTDRVGEFGFYQEDRQENRSVYADVIANINKALSDDFSLVANVGASISDERYELMGNLGNLASIPNYFTITNLNFTQGFKPRQYGYHDQNQSLFASVELGWRGLLYATLTERIEWDSALGGLESVSYDYPSVGLSGIVSEMVELPQVIDFVKVRGSWTKVSSPFSRYLVRPGYVFNEQTLGWETSTIFPARDLKPETTESWEFGLNMRLLESLTVDLTYYNSETRNQTFNVALASSSGYSSAIVQTGSITNRGIELAVGYDRAWGEFRSTTHFTYTKNINRVNSLANGAINPVTGEPIEMEELSVAVLGGTNAPEVILREGGTMNDIYVKQGLKLDANGNVWVNSQTGTPAIEEYDEYKKLGSTAPDFTMGLSQSFSYKGVNLGVVFSANVGGLVVSNTQGILDYFGASQTTADARDAGGVPMNNGVIDAKAYYQTIGTATGGYGQYYTYSATNVRLQELNISYTFPSSLIGDKVKLTAGLVGRNLWMIYNKAPFDPGLTPSASANFYQGVDFFMLPSTRNIGFNVKLQF